MIEIVVGIDIGGTNTLFGCVDKKGETLLSGSIPTQVEDKFENYLNTLVKSINNLISASELDLKIIGVGIGAPNANFRSGCIEFAANLRWKGKLQLAKIMNELMSVPVKITNDANAAALGERMFGAARGLDDFLVITLGTGLGSGIVVNGDLVYGHDGMAGELGHVIVRKNGRECGCGRKGCLETYVSATGVKRTVYKLLARHIGDSELRDVAFNKMEAKTVAEAAGRGDSVAIETFNYTGKVLGESLADICTVTSPEAIILFGGLTKAGDILVEPIKKALNDNILSVYKGKVRVLLSELGDDAALLGAAALIWNK